MRCGAPRPTARASRPRGSGEGERRQPIAGAAPRPARGPGGRDGAGGASGPCAGRPGSSLGGGGGGGGPRPPPWPPARPARGRRRLSALRGLGVPAVAGAVQSGRESRTAQWFAVRHHSSSGLCPAELRCVPCGLLYAAPGLPRHRKARSRQVPQRALPLAGGGGRLPPGERLPPRAEAEAG